MTGNLDQNRGIMTQQADAYISQDNPVNSQEYTVLDTTANVRLQGIAVNCTWTGQPTPLTVKVYVDGQVLVMTRANPVTTTYYYGGIASTESDDPAGMASLGSTQTIQTRAFILEGKSVKVTASVTGGTVSNMKARIKYAKL